MVTKSLKRLFLTILLACTFSAAAVADVKTKPCLRIGMFDVLASNEAVLETVSQIFRISDLCINLVTVPPRRAELMDLEGSLDGELQRTLLWAQLHADKMIAVPTPLFSETLVAISYADRKLSLSSMTDLKGLRVLAVGGHRWMETKLAQLMIKPVSASTVPRYMELLRYGPIDVGLMDFGLLKHMGDLSGFDTQAIDKIDYHMVLQRKHAGLLGRIDTATKIAKSLSKN